MKGERDGGLTQGDFHREFVLTIQFCVSRFCAFLKCDNKLNILLNIHI